MSESIGEHQAFGTEWERGMTYRQWLIGMALAGGSSGAPAPFDDRIERAEMAIEVATEVIRRLDQMAAANKAIKPVDPLG